jgi:hypothetical protein
MAQPGAPRRFNIVAAVVAWFGVLLQLYLSLKSSVANGKTIAEGVTIFFGYFTILTNILVALVLLLPLVAPASLVGRFFHRPGVRTSTAAAIFAVGIAYHLLLRNVWNPQGWQLVADSVLHYVTPILYIWFWWVAVPKQGLRWSHVAAWTSYPMGYLVYMLIRGELTGLYPYHFLDVGTLGYGKTLANGLGVLLGFVLVSLLFLVASLLQVSAGHKGNARGCVSDVATAHAAQHL